MFFYPQSKFANPYKVGDDAYTLEESLKLYRKHLKDTNLVKHLEELKGKNLGCFCHENMPCHAKILAELVSTLKNDF